MIKVSYNNTELESLLERRASRTYQWLLQKKGFIKALCAFKTILSVIDNIVELKYYKYLRHKKGIDFSSVTIEASGICGDLLFKEESLGHSIVIHDLIINKEYGKERTN